MTSILVYLPRLPRWSNISSHLINKMKILPSNHASYPNEIYTAFSFLGFLMCIIPLPWHLKAWNGGTCLYMFWTGTACLIFFINSIVWHGNAFNPAPIWCDICARILIGSSIGVPASSLCINRRLYLLQLNQAGNPNITKSDKMRVLATDLGISVGLPVLIMILHVIPQGHRFDIFENIGCFPSTYNTWVAIVIINVPQVLIGLVSATYAIRAIISINKRRNAFNELLSRHLNVTSSLYFRLMFLAGIEAILTVPIAGFLLILHVMGELRPWISWEDTHSNFNRADQFPATIWRGAPWAWQLEFSRWIYILCAILFFSFFGFAEEARFHYRLITKFFLKVTGIRVGQQTETITFQAGRPTTQSDPADRIAIANKKRRRADSFSTISTVALSRESVYNEGEKCSGNTLCDTQDPAHEDLGMQNEDSPAASPLRTISIIARQAVNEKTAQRDSLVSSQLSPAVEEDENERRPSVISKTVQNLRSFLNFGCGPSRKHASFPHSSQTDISTVEEGQPSKAKGRPSGRFSQHFLNLILQHPRLT